MTFRVRHSYGQTDRCPHPQPEQVLTVRGHHTRSLIAALTSLLMSLLVLEGIARIALRGDDKNLPHAFLGADDQEYAGWRERGHSNGVDLGGFAISDPLLGWRPRPAARVTISKPDSYTFTAAIEKHGLRAVETVSQQKAPGVTRIGVFGCSQTFGQGVQDHETYSARLGHSLPATEVLNFGVPGYGTDQMLLYYETFGRKFDLDVVLIAFAWFHLPRNIAGFHFFAKPRFVLDDSGHLSLLGVPVPTAQDLLDQEWHTPWPVTLADDSVLLRWTWRRLENAREREIYNPGGSAWQLTRALLRRFVTVARDARSRVVIVNLPEDGHPELDKHLEALASTLNVELVNLRDTFDRLATQGIDYRLPNDEHFNQIGHATVAEALTRYLSIHDEGTSRESHQGRAD